MSETEQTPEPETPETEPGHGGNEEAKKYRLRLRDAEAERDRLAEQLINHQHSDLARIAGEDFDGRGLYDPDDLLRYSGKNVADYVTDDGLVDSEAVTTDLRALAEQRPHLFEDRLPRSGPYVPDQGLEDTGMKPSRSWDSAFEPGQGKI